MYIYSAPLDLKLRVPLTRSVKQSQLVVTNKGLFNLLSESCFFYPEKFIR